MLQRSVSGIFSALTEVFLICFANTSYESMLKLTNLRFLHHYNQFQIRIVICIIFDTEMQNKKKVKTSFSNIA